MVNTRSTVNSMLRLYSRNTCRSVLDKGLVDQWGLGREAGRQSYRIAMCGRWRGGRMAYHDDHVNIVLP